MAPRKKKKKHRLFWTIVKIQLLLIIVALGGLGYYFYGGYARQIDAWKKEAKEIVKASDESAFHPAQSSTLFDINGTVISETKGAGDSKYVKFENIPKNFVMTMTAVEDKKFFKHNGVDYMALLRAFKAMVEERHVTQGGSTITMQLAKLIYLDSSQTWERKFKQMFVAMELEKCYDKNKILEFYFNNIYFSSGYYGIQAATEGYFNCRMEDLSISQIAFLCAIPNSPTYYDPITNYNHTIERRNLILKIMYEDGKISDRTYENALKEKIVLSQVQNSRDFKNNYVETFSYNRATKALMQEKGFEFKYYFESEEEERAYDEAFDEMYAVCQKQLYEGGYRVYTSIDLGKQELLQNSIDDALAGFTQMTEDGVYTMQGAATCIDNTTGYVVAIVGGRKQDFGTYTYNRAYQSARQSGSAIKPLNVYTPAFERGYTPETVVEDKEIPGGPQNASGNFLGPVTIRYAVEQSLNTVAWDLYSNMGPANGLAYLKAMNFARIVPEDEVPATSLGGFTKGVSTLEMASAYATLQNKGLYREPTCIKRIEDAEGKVIYQSEQVEKVVYKEDAARQMTDVLQSVMTNGLGQASQLGDIPSAGKTGTTNDDKDLWFCGYTAYYTTAVWVGYDIPQTVPDAPTANYPGKIWKNYMLNVHNNLEVKPMYE